MSQSPAEQVRFTVPEFNPDFDYVVGFARRVAEILNIDQSTLTFQPAQHAGTSGVLIDNAWAFFWKQGVPDDLVTELPRGKQGDEPDWAYIVALKETANEGISPKNRLQQAFYPDYDFSFTVVEIYRNWALALGAALGKVKVDRAIMPFKDMLAKSKSGIEV